MALVFLVFVLAAVFLHRSFRNESNMRNRGRVAVYLSDDGKDLTRATPVPYRDMPEQSKDMMFALVNVPTREVTVSGVHPVRINVVIRNIGKLDIRDFYLRIDSNATIKVLSEEELSLTDNEIDAHIQMLKASSNEHIFPIEIIPRPHQHEDGLLISVTGVGLQSYAAASKLLFIDGTEPSKPAPTAVKEPAK